MTYPANEKAPAAQFCPQCGSHVPRIAELERQLTHAPIAIAHIGSTGHHSIELYAPGLPPGDHDLYCAPVSERERIAELEKALDPRRWAKEQIAAWHLALPDTVAAFAALRSLMGSSTNG